MSIAETAELAVKLSLKDGISSGVSKVTGSLSRLDRATGNTQKALGKAKANLERAAYAAGTIFVGGVVAAVKAAGDFQASLLTIGTIVDKSKLPQIGEDIRKIARDTGIGVDELGAAYYDLVSAGVKAADATSVLTDATHLAIGGLGTTTETVDLLTTAMNAYGLSASGVTKATDMFAQAIADGKVKASEIAGSFADIASLAKATGVGIDQIAASYAYLTAQGVPAAEVTTEMQRAIVSLLNPSKDLAAAGKKLGINWGDSIRKNGLVPTLEKLREYADKNKIPLNTLLGRIEAVKYVLQTTGGAEGGFLTELGRIRKSTGEATAQFEERQQGLNFQLGRLKALAIDAGITIGSALLPKIVPLVEKLNDFLSTNHDKIAEFGQNLADGFGKVDWGAIAGGLQITGAAAKTLVEAFLALPPDVQKLAIAAIAINKAGGGIVTAVGKDLLGLALGGGKVGGVGGLLGGVQKVWVVNMGPGGLGGAAGAAAGGGLPLIIPLAVLAAGIVEAVRETMAAHDAGPAAAYDTFKSGGTQSAQFGPRTSGQATAIATDRGLTAKAAADLEDVDHSIRAYGNAGYISAARQIDLLRQIRAKKWAIRTTVVNHVVVPVYVKATKTYRITATKMASSSYGAQLTGIADL